MKFTHEQKVSAYSQLTDSEKTFADSLDYIEIVENLGQEFNLEAHMVDILETEIYSTLLHLQTTDELIVNLEKEGISESVVLQLVQKIYKLNIGIHPDIKKSDPLLLDEGNEHLLVEPTLPEVPEPVIKTLHEEPPVPPQVAPVEVASPAPSAPAPQTKQPIYIPPKSAVEAKLAELKKIGNNSVLEKHYPGPDPYREPV